jgi:hypothetical protein
MVVNEFKQTQDEDSSTSHETRDSEIDGIALPRFLQEVDDYMQTTPAWSFVFAMIQPMATALGDAAIGQLFGQRVLKALMPRLLSLGFFVTLLFA